MPGLGKSGISRIFARRSSADIGAGPPRGSLGRVGTRSLPQGVAAADGTSREPAEWLMAVESGDEVELVRLYRPASGSGERAAEPGAQHCAGEANGRSDRERRPDPDALAEPRADDRGDDRTGDPGPEGGPQRVRELKPRGDRALGARRRLG